MFRRHSSWFKTGHLRPKWSPTVVGSGSRSIASQTSPSEFQKPVTAGRVPYSKPYPTAGHEQLRFLRRAGIFAGTDFTRIKAPRSPKGVTVKIAPYHCLRHTERDWFPELGHPKGLLIVERCLEQHKTRPLWKQTHVQGGTEPVVRGKARARINVALRQALAIAGYDADGKKMDSPKSAYPERVGNSHDAWRKSIMELCGTVQVTVQDPIAVLNQPFAPIRAMFEVVVRSMEEQLGRPQPGGSIDSGEQGRNGAPAAPRDRNSRGDQVRPRKFKRRAY